MAKSKMVIKMEEGEMIVEEENVIALNSVIAGQYYEGPRLSPYLNGPVMMLLRKNLKRNHLSSYREMTVPIIVGAKPLDLDSCYIDLLCARADGRTARDARLVKALESDILDGKKRIVVTGTTGSGKTETTRFIPRKWARGKLLHDFKAVVRVDLEEVNSTDVAAQLAAIFQPFDSEDFSPELAAEIALDEDFVLVLFDNFDSAERETQDSILEYFREDRRPRSKVSMVIFTRHEKFPSQILVESHLKILPLTLELCQEYILDKFPFADESKKKEIADRAKVVFEQFGIVMRYPRFFCPLLSAIDANGQFDFNLTPEGGNFHIDMSGFLESMQTSPLFGVQNLIQSPDSPFNLDILTNVGRATATRFLRTNPDLLPSNGFESWMSYLHDAVFQGDWARALMGNLNGLLNFSSVDSFASLDWIAESNGASERLFLVKTIPSLRCETRDRNEIVDSLLYIVANYRRLLPKDVLVEEVAIFFSSQEIDASLRLLCHFVAEVWLERVGTDRDRVSADDLVVIFVRSVEAGVALPTFTAIDYSKIPGLCPSCKAAEKFRDFEERLNNLAERVAEENSISLQEIGASAAASCVSRQPTMRQFPRDASLTEMFGNLAVSGINGESNNNNSNNNNAAGNLTLTDLMSSFTGWAMNTNDCDARERLIQQMGRIEEDFSLD